MMVVIEAKVSMPLLHFAQSTSKIPFPGVDGAQLKFPAVLIHTTSGGIAYIAM